MKCRRTACPNQAEGHKHKETGDEYCSKCAIAINKVNNEEIIKRDEGHLLGTKHCAGCNDDYYNETRKATGGCWCRKSAVMVEKQQVHVSQKPVRLESGKWGHKNPYKMVPSCYHVPQYVMISKNE